ncbi:hypothetical protein BC940DRAFT_329923 [Gongronella butleri]|nr:hypothetical protein BC940DRAFT_329923 [Gongronella butleri]
MSMLLGLMCLSCELMADRITINQPAVNQTYAPGSDMLIDYAVHFEGMAKLGSASVAILLPNYTVITFLPEGDWMDDETDTRGAKLTWPIPEDLEPNDYVVHVAGPSTYMCSANNNGQAPFTQCHTFLTTNQTFTIAR